MRAHRDTGPNRGGLDPENRFGGNVSLGMMNQTEGRSPHEEAPNVPERIASAHRQAESVVPTPEVFRRAGVAHGAGGGGTLRCNAGGEPVCLDACQLRNGHRRFTLHALDQLVRAGYRTLRTFQGKDNATLASPYSS